MAVLALGAVLYVAYEYDKRRKDPARAGTPILYDWERVAIVAVSVIVGWAVLTNIVGSWAADNGSNDPVGGILFWAGLLIVGWLALTYLLTKGVLGSLFGSRSGRRYGPPRGEDLDPAQRERGRQDRTTREVTDEEWELIETFRKRRNGDKMLTRSALRAGFRSPARHTLTHASTAKAGRRTRLGQEAPDDLSTACYAP